MKKYATLNAKKQRGFLDIQLNSVLIISAILGGAALFAGVKYVGDAKVDSLASGHRQILDGLRSTYQNANGFAGVSTTVAINAGVVPSSWIQGTRIVSPVSGDVTVRPATIVSANDGLELEYENLDSDECGRFVNVIFGGSQTIDVGGTEVKSATTNQINAGSLVTACNNASNTVSAVFTKF